MALVVKNLLANAGDIRHLSLIPGLGRSWFLVVDPWSQSQQQSMLIDSSFNVLGTHVESQGDAPSWQSVHITPHEVGLVCMSHLSEWNGGSLGPVARKSQN